MLSESENKLYTAIKEGDLPTVTAFIASQGKSYLDQPLGGKQMPIHIAAQYGRISILLYFIEIDPTQLNKKDKFKQTPLLWAAAHGQEEALQLFISLSADLDSATDQPDSQYHQLTALKWAKKGNHLQCIERLQEAHCQKVREAIRTNPNLLIQPDEHGETLLFESVRLGHIKAIKYLLNQGADECSRHVRVQFNLLHIAAKVGDIATVQYLHEEVSSDFIDDRDINGQTPIIWAAAKGHSDVVQYLAEKGADLLLCSHTGTTPILAAIKYQHSDIVFYLILRMARQQPIETLFVYIQNAQVAIKLMGHNVIWVPLLLNDVRIYELIHASRCCETSVELIDAYEPATTRCPSRYRQINKQTGQSTFFSPIDPPLGSGRHGMVRRLAGTSCVVKSNHADFGSEAIESEQRFMQKAYPAPGKYHLFFYTRKVGDKDTKHYRFIAPERKGETLGKWASKEKTAFQLAEIIALTANELYRLHSLQIIHGDPKDDNILVCLENERYGIFFVDFGAAYAANGKIIPLKLKSTETRYPPERAFASTKPSPKQDIYVLATTFKTILAKHPSYEQVKLHFPSIPAFIAQSINPNPELRPSLKQFCRLLQEEINEAEQIVSTTALSGP